MSAFPERAKVVIVGLGGIVGASISHHLIERGRPQAVRQRGVGRMDAGGFEQIAHAGQM